MYSKCFRRALSNPLDFSKKKHKVCWSGKDFEFTGIPFVVVVSKVLGCHHGWNWHLKQKQPSKRRREEVRRIIYKYGCCYFFLIIYFVLLICKILN